MRLGFNWHPDSHLHWAAVGIGIIRDSNHPLRPSCDFIHIRCSIKRIAPTFGAFGRGCPHYHNNAAQAFSPVLSRVSSKRLSDVSSRGACVVTVTVAVVPATVRLSGTSRS